MWHIDFMHTENIKCFYAETNDETSEQRKKNTELLRSDVSFGKRLCVVPTNKKYFIVV